MLLLCVSTILILAGDVELNPGHGCPEKVICGSFNQGSPHFNESAGKQCVCNTLWSICFSNIKALHNWSQWDLDRVLTLGKELYEKLGFIHHLSIPEKVGFNDTVFEIIKSDEVTGLLECDSERSLEIQQCTRFIMTNPI